MIDKEKQIYNSVSTALRQEFPDIYVIGTEFVKTSPKFPACSLVQTNNTNNSTYATFSSFENVVVEDYKAEVFSNLSTGKEAQTKAIIECISDVMSNFGYERIFCEPISNADATIHRRIARFRKRNVI